MPLLREPANSANPADTLAEHLSPPAISAAALANGPANRMPKGGRRRGARVRARDVGRSLRQVQRNAWDIRALGLPAPLLTAPMALGVVTRLIRPEARKSVNTADWQDAHTVRSIDLSDGLKLMVENPVIEGPVIEGPVIEHPVIEQPVIENPVVQNPVLDPPVVENPPVETLIVEHPVVEGPPSLDSAEPAHSREAARTRALPPPNSARSQLPDPMHLLTDPSRLPEALLAAVLSLVAMLAAWATAAPSGAWIPLSALPAVGLIALMLPGGESARMIRAGALLSAAACLPVIAPTLAPVTLVVALATIAAYPTFVEAMAGRTVLVMAIGSLAIPLVFETVMPPLFNDPADGVLTSFRLALGSGIPLVALIGGLAIASRRVVTLSTSQALTRERTARTVTAKLDRATGLDPSTGLPNRAALLRATTLALAAVDQPAESARSSAGSAESAGSAGSAGSSAESARSAGSAATRDAGRAQVGIVLASIDRFADLADSLGAVVADDVADRVADRLRTEYPTERMVSRIGRHEFAVLLPTATSDACATVARRITVLMAEPFLSRDRDLSITCSMGAAMSGPGLNTPADLLQAADEATRAAQASGRARWVLFDQAVRARAHSQATLEIELRDAVQQHSIEVAFQPVLALSPDGNDRIVGAEALARWTRSDGTIVEPTQFIPMADELGLGSALGMQVIERALAALVVWRHEGVGVDQVWVNLSSSQLNDPEFAHEAAAQLAIRGLAASSLVLEISAGRLTETDQTRSTLGLLRSLGIAVALDDFGQRGTSLTALRRLPISAVKLDQSLAGELGQQDAVPRSIAQLCRTLGLRVVVEGVETVLQLHAAREIGADAVQGHVIARPMSAEDVTDLLTLRLPRNFRLR